MRKILLCASVALLFAGCAKENIIPAEGNDTQKGDITLSFTASQAGFGTKAVIGNTTTDGEGHKSTAINWQSTDKISVFDGASKNCLFSTKDFSTEAANCTFEGNVTVPKTDYTAVYPYTAAASINETGVISGITLPATQTAVEGSFDTKAALMAAKTVKGGRNLSFQNLVGYVKVTTDFACTKIELQAASKEALAGKGTITFTDGTPVFTLGEGAATAIALEGTIAEGKTYYIAVPAQTLAAGWSISFTATDSKVYKREGTKPIEFKRNTVLNLGTVKQEDFLPYVTFSAESEQTFRWKFCEDFGAFKFGQDEGFEYRLGYGEWKKIETSEDNQATFGNGTILQIRGISSRGTSGPLIQHGYIEYYSTISFGNDTKVACSGDIRTLVNYKDYKNAKTSEARFIYLFDNCSQLTSAPDLPATELAIWCYYYMFAGCSSLESAPALPATTLALECYSGMFYKCKNIASSIELPAEIMYSGCYQYIFDGCESLKEITVKAKYLQDYVGKIELSKISDDRLFENFGYWLPDDHTGTVHCTQELNSLLSQYPDYKYGWTVTVL